MPANAAITGTVACLRIPCFALRIALLDQPHLDGNPLILGNPERGRPVVRDATPEAVADGVQAGMTLREATAMCPRAIVLAPDPVRESLIAQAIHLQLDQYSPLVEPDDQEQGCWYIDLTGLERLYGPPAQAARQLLACANPILRARVGVAPGKFAARVASGIARAGEAHVVEAQDVAGFLADASVTWLPLPDDTIRQMERLGIPTLGALAKLPGRKVAARFGPTGRTAWNLAQGRDDRPVTPPPRTESIVEELVMPAPAVSREMLLIGLRQLVNRAFGQPGLKGRHIREVTIRAIIEGNRRSWERTLTLKEPCGATRVISSLDLRLQALELPGPVEAVSLEFSGISNATIHQESLPMLGARALEPLAAAVHQLRQRYGLSPIYHIAEVEPWSRIPERRHALITYEP